VTFVTAISVKSTISRPFHVSSDVKPFSSRARGGACPATSAQRIPSRLEAARVFPLMPEEDFQEFVKHRLTRLKEKSLRWDRLRQSVAVLYSPCFPEYEMSPVMMIRVAGPLSVASCLTSAMSALRTWSCLTKVPPFSWPKWMSERWRKRCFISFNYP